MQFLVIIGDLLTTVVLMRCPEFWFGPLMWSRRYVVQRNTARHENTNRFETSIPWAQALPKKLSFYWMPNRIIGALAVQTD
jgi:hypothetical protein